jgi:pullulanase/glycogen debranching enzyme
VEVVFGNPANGYIADDGTGIDPALPLVAFSRLADGIWEGRLAEDFETFKSLPYMYRIKSAQGQTVYRTDIYSRSQIGIGDKNPAKTDWPGTLKTLDGTVSCSVIIDPDVVRRDFESTPPGVQPDLISAEEFWAREFTSGLPVHTRIEDLVIYELHVGSLGFGKDGVGHLSDALSFLDHLVDLGVNAIELLDNGSTGFTPRFWAENVRQQFISAAAFLIEEMHVDGLRVELTQAIHRDNALHANGQSIDNANIFGQKFLREWSRTLHMIRPTTMLIAEDHTGWDAVTKSPAQGGLGFNAKSELAFYHSFVVFVKQ